MVIILLPYFSFKLAINVDLPEPENPVIKRILLSELGFNVSVLYSILSVENIIDSVVYFISSGVNSFGSISLYLSIDVFISLSSIL